jgi:CHASE2 domain-containing sensor protein
MEYSGTVEILLVAFWATLSLVLAWFVRRRFYVYFASVALSAPAIGYSMVGYGYLEMGGIIHALSCGLFVLPFHLFFQRWRRRRLAARP